MDRILEIIYSTNIDCPDCTGLVDDEQYTCTTCWCQGGNGTINIGKYLKTACDHPNHHPSWKGSLSICPQCGK